MEPYSDIIVDAAALRLSQSKENQYLAKGRIWMEATRSAICSTVYVYVGTGEDRLTWDSVAEFREIEPGHTVSSDDYSYTYNTDWEITVTQGIITTHRFNLNNPDSIPKVKEVIKGVIERIYGRHT